VNGFLWLGVLCTVFLAVSVVLDGLDASFDMFEIGPGWFSLPVVAAFLAAFGFGTGALVGSLGGLAVVPGITAGVGFAALAARLTTAAIRMPTDITDTESALVGSLGRVVTAPAPPRYGEVLLHRPSGPVKVACTAAEPIATGTEIVVVDVVSSTLVVVVPFDADGPPELVQ
jgi:membrane-bound ClpP family serine protease